MRFLRMLTNSALGGALAAAFVAVLVLQLNPLLPLSPWVLASLYRVLLVFYGTHLALACYVAIVGAEIVSRDTISPGWLSLRLLAWIGALGAGTAALLMWLNLDTYRGTLDAEAAQRLAAGAAGTAVCAVLLLIIAIVHYSFGRRGSRLSGALFAITIAASLTLPLVARGGARRFEAPRPPAPDPPQALVATPADGRIFLVLLDGASLEFVAPLTADGRLPNFGRILDGGASAHMTTIRPTQPGTVWAMAATGKFPPGNGVRSAATYGFGASSFRIELLPDLCFAHGLVHFGVLDERPNTSRDVEAPSFWEIASAFGVRVGIAGWPLTAPATPVTGYIVADGSHLAGGARVAFDEEGLVSPPDAAAVVSVVSQTLEAARAAHDGGRPGAGPSPRDLWYREVARALNERFSPQMVALRYEGLDVSGHRYLRYALPRAFGDVSDAERRQYGRVLERQYEWVDEELGKLMQTLGPEDVLLVVSGFGMEPVSLAKRVVARVLGEPELSGTHERGPDGFILGWGGPVKRGRIAVGSIADLAPTVLYFLGLPIGRDMDGHARTDLFLPAFTERRPITFIPRYER